MCCCSDTGRGLLRGTLARGEDAFVGEALRFCEERGGEELLWEDSGWEICFGGAAGVGCFGFCALGLFLDVDSVVVDGRSSSLGWVLLRVWGMITTARRRFALSCKGELNECSLDTDVKALVSRT